MAITQPIYEVKLNDLMAKLVGYMGAAMSAALVVLGDRLGLYHALSQGSATLEELAKRSATAERNTREGLAAQAASGYVQYDADTGRYSVSPEQALAFAQEGSPAFVPGAFQIVASLYRDEPRIADAFRSGKGVAALFQGTERFVRSGYNANFVNHWVPALSGVQEKLERGANVADVGCGHGASTIIMAMAFPKSSFAGFDYHEPSIRRAREAAKEAGVVDRIRFEVAPAHAYPSDNDDGA